MPEWDPGKSGTAALAAPRARLLVIDDDLVQRSIIKRICAQIGFEAIPAATYDDAERRLMAESFDCLTLDLSLGGHDGVEVLQLLARLGRDIPVVIISGCEERVLRATVDVARSLGIRISEPLPKPLNLGELRRQLLPFVGMVAEGEQPVVPPRAVSAEDMGAALAQRGIGVSFTPVMELASGHVTGCIAAPHWRSAAAGHIEGVALLDLAESFNLAAPLAEAAIERALLACREMTGMRDGFAIAVDASAFLAADVEAVAKIERMTQLHGVAMERLTLLVQQDSLALNHERVLDALVRLTIKGAGATLTEFGAAPVMFAALSRLPAGRLALDPALVAVLPTSGEARKVVRAVVAMAHALGLRVVAPAVDQATLVPLLREAGCDETYGAAIAPRADAAQMPSVIEAWRGAMMPRAVSA